MRSRRIFLIISRPPINTNGNMAAVPTHQLAVCLGPKAVSTTAIAAGLKICLPLIVIKYLDAIASPDTASKNKILKPVGVGVIISANIRAVISDDSGFIGASNMYENTLLIIQQAAKSIVAEIAI